jgi:hypothetical protein
LRAVIEGRYLIESAMMRPEVVSFGGCASLNVRWAVEVCGAYDVEKGLLALIEPDIQAGGFPAVGFFQNIVIAISIQVGDPGLVKGDAA